MAKAETNLKSTTADAEALAAQADAQAQADALAAQAQADALAEATLVARITKSIEGWITNHGVNLPDVLADIAGVGMGRARAHVILTKIGYVKGGFGDGDGTGGVTEAQADDALLALALGATRWADCVKAGKEVAKSSVLVKESGPKLARKIAAKVAEGMALPDATATVDKATRTLREVLASLVKKATEALGDAAEMVDLTEYAEVSDAIATLAEFDWDAVPLAEAAPSEPDAEPDAEKAKLLAEIEAARKREAEHAEKLAALIATQK